VLVALFDAATLGTITQEPMPAIAGYVAFFTIGLFLVAVAALPPTTRLAAVTYRLDGQQPSRPRQLPPEGESLE
jgi:hypothetical protein